MKSIIGRVIASAILFLLMAGSAVTLTYGATATEISLSLPDKVAPGGTFTATINVSRVDNFDACNYDVSFDPAVLILENVTNGQLGSSQIPVDTWIKINAGTARIVQNVPGVAGVSGSGYLATLRFYVVGSAGQNSTISLSNGMLSNNLAEAIPATWSGGSVSITSSQPSSQGTPPTPASFAISNLSVTPQEIRPAEQVAISARVTNTGGSEGSYTVVLNINGVEEARQIITLAPGTSKIVSFPTTRATTGKYTIIIDNNIAQFIVAAPPPPSSGEQPTGVVTPPPAAPPSLVLPETINPIPGPLPKPVISPASEPTPTPTTESGAPQVSGATPSPVPSTPANLINRPALWVAGGVVAIVLGLIIFWQVRKRVY